MNTKLTVGLTLELLEFLSKFESNDNSPPSSLENKAISLKEKLKSELNTEYSLLEKKPNSTNVVRRAGGRVDY